MRKYWSQTAKMKTDEDEMMSAKRARANAMSKRMKGKGKKGKGKKGKEQKGCIADLNLDY